VHFFFVFFLDGVASFFLERHFHKACVASTNSESHRIGGGGIHKCLGGV